MKIAIASDHAGYEQKERLKPLLDELGMGVRQPFEVLPAFAPLRA